MLSFFSWWYGPGLVGLVRAIQRRMQQLADMFSVAILLRTLFSPWRRIITYPGAGLEAHLRAMLDNMVSRVIGLLVRISVLLADDHLIVREGFRSLLKLERDLEVVGGADTAGVLGVGVRLGVGVGVGDGVGGAALTSSTAAEQITSAPPPLAEPLHWLIVTRCVDDWVPVAVHVSPTSVPPLAEPLH